MIKQLKYSDHEFPQNLKKIPNPPKTIYYEGNIKLLNTPIISIIGSRKCTKSGQAITKKFAKELVAQRITIASGMAIGIDAQAHLETLKQGGKTIAVLPSGLLNIYPEENKDLYKEIIKKDGLAITEYPNEKQAESKTFLERNRIVSGISIGILIIEAMHRSGTSVTAKYAIEQGKKVFAIPHEINNKNGKGTNELIRKGAILITKTKEIFQEYEFLEYKEKAKKLIKLKNSKLEISEKRRIKTLKKKKSPKQENIKYQKLKNQENKTKNKLENQQNKIHKEQEKQKNKKYKNQKNQEHKKLEKKQCNNEEYKEIYNLINETPITIDEIKEKTNKKISEINSILFMLEIEDYIEKTQGGYKCKPK